MGFRNPQRHKAARKKQEKPRSERANAKAARKAQSAAQAKTEELRNALQTRVEQGKAGLGCVPADED